MLYCSIVAPEASEVFRQPAFGTSRLLAIFRQILETCEARESGCTARTSMLQNSRFGRDKLRQRGFKRTTGTPGSEHKKKSRVLGVTSKSTGSAGVADRYAVALFELAEADKAMDQIADELNGLDELIRESNDLKRLIRSPVISRGDQRAAMDALLAKAGVSDLTRRFVSLVARNRRLFELPQMIAAYRDMLAGRRGESTAEVVSAKALSKGQLTALSEALTKTLGTKVALAASVDTGLLGGLVVKVGSRMVDSSLRTKLHRLRLSMKGIG